MTKIIQNEIFHHIKGNPLNDFEILKHYFRGSTANVYKVKSSSGSIFCLKIYYDDEEVFPEDVYLKESHLLNEDFPSIAKVYKVDKYSDNDKEVHYSIMEYVNGTPLYEFIKTKKYNTAFVKDLANKLYKANRFLLKKNIAHRDITTSNILIKDDGDCSLIDFGMMSKTNTENLTDIEKSFFNEELEEILGAAKPINSKTLPKYWKMITLFEIRRVIHDVIVKKRKTTYQDIKVFIGLDYEIRMIATNDKKYVAILYTLKELVKLSRRIIFKMTYFHK